MCRICDTCDWVRLKSAQSFTLFGLLMVSLASQRVHTPKRRLCTGRQSECWACCCWPWALSLISTLVLSSITLWLLPWPFTDTGKTSSWSLVSLLKCCCKYSQASGKIFLTPVFYLNSDAKLSFFRAFTSWKLYKVSPVCHNTRTTVQAAFMTNISSFSSHRAGLLGDCVLLTRTMFLCLLTIMQIFINVHLNGILTLEVTEVLQQKI